MTDPVTNVEIEDVLSSIRRLVTENGRPETARSMPTGDDRPEAEQAVKPVSKKVVELPEKLVLTPALRVADAPTTDEAVSNITPIADTASETDLDGIEGVLRDAVQEHVEDMIQDAVQDELDDENAWVDEGDVSTNLTDADETEDHFTPTTAEDKAAQAPEGKETLEDRIADLEAVVADRDDQWEPDGEGSDDYAGSPVDPLSWQDDSPDEVGTLYLHQVEDAEIIPEDTLDLAANHFDVTDGDAWDAAAKDEPLEGMEVEDHDLLTSQISEAPDTQGTDESIDLFGADDTFLDEDTLREMVSEIVRQELQGSLGERITRNVRKLVRREIHRALAAQELD